MPKIDSSVLVVGLCVIGLLVLAVNGAAFVNYRRMRRRQGGQGMPSRRAPRVFNPWEKEDAALKDLSQRVEQFKHPPAEPPSLNPEEKE